MLHCRSVVLVVLFSVVLFSCREAANAGAALPSTFRQVALYGDIAPGAAQGFVDFTAPVLNNNGAVAFSGAYGEDFFPGIWSEATGAGTLSSVAVFGDSAPSSSGGSFESFISSGSLLQFDDLGHTSFHAELDDFSTGIWSDRDRPTTPLTTIALQGATAPGTIGSRPYNGSFTLRSAGASMSQLVFFANFSPVAGPNNFPSSGIMSEGGGTLTAVAQVTDDAPGSFNPALNDAAKFDQFGTPTINSAGTAAFMAGTLNSGIGSIGEQGVWTAAGGTLTPVALHGTGAPGTTHDFGAFFADSAVINEAGNVAFTAGLNTLIGGMIPDGIWVARGGWLQKVALETEPAAGTGTNFSGLRGNLIDGAGNALFAAELADGRDTLFRESAPGVLETIGLQGTPAADTGLNFLNVLDFAVNASGQVAFTAQLDDFGDDYLFAIDTAGVVHKIVGPGDTFNVAGFTVEVVFVDFASPFFGNSFSSGFNDRGEVAFVASLYSEEAGFEDQFPEGLVGVFVGAVPEPPSGLDGDFNQDTMVNAADYTVWRDGVPVDFTLADYSVWTGAFGDVGSIVATNAHTIPEPNMFLLSVLGSVVVILRAREPAR